MLRRTRGTVFNTCTLLAGLLAVSAWSACGGEDGVKLGPDFVCNERPDDPTGYLRPIRAYLANHFETYPVDPNRLAIRKVTPGSEVNWLGDYPYLTADYDFVLLSCCYTGDTAVVERDAKTVVDFIVGFK